MFSHIPRLYPKKYHADLCSFQLESLEILSCLYANVKNKEKLINKMLLYNY